MASSKKIEIDLLIESRRNWDSSPSERMNPMTDTDEGGKKRDSRISEKLIFRPKEIPDNFSFNNSQQTSNFMATSEDFNAWVSDDLLKKL